jgi:hypothetical protein
VLLGGSRRLRRIHGDVSDKSVWNHSLSLHCGEELVRDGQFLLVADPLPLQLEPQCNFPSNDTFGFGMTVLAYGCSSDYIVGQRWNRRC